MSTFEDHFSRRAQDYARHRPQYPEALFSYLASIAPNRRLAWDCGTGNGQAAMGLARHFDRVVATDASADQLSHATPHDRIEYRIERAEEVDLENRSVDLVTVAAAVHWFDLESFYAAARRVLAAHGVLAVWTYLESAIAPEIDEVLTHYSTNVLAGHWPDRFRYVSGRYRNLPFPLDEITAPAFEVRAEWSLDQLEGFIRSWSGSLRYQQQRGEDPLDVIRPALARAWGDPERPRLTRWPLYLRVGRTARGLP